MKGEIGLIMQVYLLRHGIAEESHATGNDFNRRLTDDGKNKLQDVLRSANRVGVKPGLILTSPLIRAIETAEIARTKLRCREKLLETKALTPGSTVEQVWDEVRAHRHEEELMLVGHDPLFSLLAGFLLGAPRIKVDFKKGALMRIDFDNLSPLPHGILRWYLTPKLAAAPERSRLKKEAGL